MPSDFDAPAGGQATMEREMTRPMVKAVESRAEVESLEEMQAERRRILPDYAKLAAKFKGGNQASADTKRKQHRALVMKRVRANMNVTGDKEPSEALLERLANADVEHIAFCEAIERDFVEYVLLDYKLTEIQERIRSRETELLCYNSELRLSR